MTGWWDEPYRGSPPPAGIKGFPRALYPPDAAGHGKQPSSKGPDVIAYKRAISRLGRWPWQEFDDGYWNDFAHGSQGPDVPNSGVAGVQYQQHIDATGWLGKQTYNTLCYALIPQELQHGGQPAFDHVAIQLLNEAWEMFHGHEPDTPSGTVRQAALERARGELGYVEMSGNRTKYGQWYGMDGQPWCSMFTTWAYETNPQGQSPSFAKGSRYAYVPYLVADARAHQYGLQTTDDPVSGDLVAYDWGWDGEYDHVGLFETWLSYGDFYAIEGNTSTASNSNGGQVMRRTRNRSGQGTVFVKVAEP
jgi:hypothetical protein